MMPLNEIKNRFREICKEAEEYYRQLLVGAKKE